MRKGGNVRAVELFPMKVDPFTLNLRVYIFNTLNLYRSIYVIFL